MIVHEGFQTATREQLVHARKRADESFCATASPVFDDAGLPTFENWKPGCSTTLLKLANVEPHDDPWVGSHKDVLDFNNPPQGFNQFGEPLERLAIFWLLEVKSRLHDRIRFYTEGKWIQLKAGQFVVFDDSKTHAVMAESKWVGAAWQLWMPE